MMCFLVSTMYASIHEGGRHWLDTMLRLGLRCRAEVLIVVNVHFNKKTPGSNITCVYMYFERWKWMCGRFNTTQE